MKRFKLIIILLFIVFKVFMFEHNLYGKNNLSKKSDLKDKALQMAEVKEKVKEKKAIGQKSGKEAKREGKGVGGKIIEKVVANINESVITLSELEYFYKKQSEEDASLSKEEALSILVDNELILQLARGFNVEVKPKEIKSELDKLELKNRNAEEDVSSSITAIERKYIENKIKLQKNRENLIKYIVKENLVLRPREEDIKLVYEENKASFYNREQFLVSHILIKLSRDDTYDELEEKERLIKRIKSLLDNKEDTFQSLAKKYSDDLKTKYQGGRIGWYDYETLSAIQPNIASSAILLKVGDISDIIPSATGYHIVKLLNKREERQVSFLEAKRFIASKILFNRAAEYLDYMVKLKKKQSYINIGL